MDSLKDESKLLKRLVDNLLYRGDMRIHMLLNLTCNDASLLESKSYSKVQLRRVEISDLTKFMAGYMFTMPIVLRSFDFTILWN